MTGSHRREPGAAGRRYIHDTPAGKIALQGARRLFGDLLPGGIRNGCELAMQIIHSVVLSGSQCRASHWRRVWWHWAERDRSLLLAYPQQEHRRRRRETWPT